MFKLVMQRFRNLKVGSVFGFLHPKTLVFGFKKKKYINFFNFILKTETAVLVCSCSSFPLHTALGMFPLVLKTTKQSANIQTSYSV